MIANQDREGPYSPLGRRGRWIMLAVCGSVATGYAVWDMLARHWLNPTAWVIGLSALLALIPASRRPLWLRDLEHNVSLVRTGFGVFALGLVLDLTPILAHGILPYKLTVWLAIGGIGFMVLGLLAAIMGTNEWAERYMASHPDARERFEAMQRQRRRR